MSKKSKLKKKKHIVIVKRKTSSSTAKNQNNIVIRIDNSGKRKAQRKTTNSSERTAPAPQPQVIHRVYNDIGNYTQEIAKRNTAVLEAQALEKKINNETKPKSSTLAERVEPVAKLEIPIETSTVPTVPQKLRATLLKPETTRLGDTPADKLFKRSLFRKMMTTPINEEEEDDDDEGSPIVKGLDLAFMSTLPPKAPEKKKTNNFRGARPLDELTLKSVTELEGLIKRSKNPEKIKAFKEAIDYKKGIVDIRNKGR